MDILENNIKDICNNYYKYLLSLQNVNGVGYGFKYINNLNTFKPCLNVLVKEKLPVNNITTNNLIPKAYMGITTDVIEVGTPKIKNQTSKPIKEKFRPLQSGCSISTYTNLGTLGCIVTKPYYYPLKQYFILGNAHVLAYYKSSEIPIGSPVFQPSLNFANKNRKNTIAYLKTYIDLKFNTINDIENLQVNYVDCAIAKILNSRLISPNIHILGEIKGVGKIYLGEKVRRVSAISGLTEGDIKTIHTTIILEHTKTEIMFFKELILSNLSSRDGDSGAIVVNNSNEVLGLYIGGSGEESYMCDINLVLSYLNVSLYTG